MNTTKGKLLNQISELLTIYVGSLQLNNSVNRLNQNIDGEDFICELLNKVFGWKLENLNKKTQNYPGIDLGDFDNRICVQVTSDTKRKKIETTLNLIEKKGYDKDFDRVIFMYFSLQKPRFIKKFVTERIAFDPASDCFSMKEVFTEINKLDVEKIGVIGRYLDQMLESDVSIVYEGDNNNIEKEQERIKRLGLAKLRSLGVDELIAWDILKNTSIDSRLLINEESENLRFLIGGFGSGKSHQLYCLFLKLLNDYKNDEANLFFPVFLEAKNIKEGELEGIISANISYNRRKLYLLIDGMDEMPLDKAVNLIEDLDIIVNSNECVKAIVSTRPLTIMHDRTQIYTRSLSIQEIDELYCLINNVSRSNIEYRFGNNKKALLNTLSKPFCAVVFCLYAKKHRIFNEMDFVRIFIEKTVEKIFIKNPTCEAVVKKLAIKSVDYSYGTIDKSEVDASCDLNILLGTGLFVEEGRTITFALPITAQWLAATAIREKYIDIDEILDDEERLFKWIHPFSMLFNRISFSESKDFFVKIMKTSPGIATLIVRAGEDLAAGTLSDSKKINGEQLYFALSNWLSVFNFNNVPYISNGMLNTICFNQIGSYIIYALRSDYLGKNVEVKNISLYNTGGDYLYVKSCGIKSQATWPWIEALDFITDAIIEKQIKNRGFVLEESILEDEFIWSTSLKLLRMNHFTTTSIEVKKMVDYLEKIPQCDEITGPGLGTINYRCISMGVNKLKCQGKNLIKCPYIQGTQPLKGFIWSQYSTEEMKNYIEDVYEKALNVYKHLIDSYFSSLKMQMGFYQLLPAQMVGYFDFNPNLDHGPSIMWGLLPYDGGVRSAVSLEYGDTRDLTSFSEEMYSKVKKLDYIDLERPCMSYGTQSQVCYNNTQTPVTDIVYEWLKSDLKRIGLCKK